MQTVIRKGLTLRFFQEEKAHGRAQSETEKTELILDLIEHPDDQIEAGLVGQVVAGHWAKLESRTAGSSEKPHLILKEYAATSFPGGPSPPPVFHKVRAQPGGDNKRLPFSTAAFLDGLGLPHIVIAQHIDYPAAIISAFNSCLDIINLRHAQAGPGMLRPKEPVFGGLNSHPVSIIHAGKCLPGFLRSAHHNYAI